MLEPLQRLTFVKVYFMINNTNLSNAFYYEYNSWAKAQKTLSFEEQLKANNFIIGLSENLNEKVYELSSSMSGEIPQSKYENALKSVLNKMKSLLQSKQDSKEAQEWGSRLYENFLVSLSPTTNFDLKEIAQNTYKIINTDEKLKSDTLMQSKNELTINLNSNNNNKTSKALRNLLDELGKYEAVMKAGLSAARQFFGSFESEFSAAELDEIINNLATIEAYHNYKAHNIDLPDGSKLTWSYENGEYKIQIQDFNVKLKGENQSKLLRDTRNLQSLLEAFNQRENLKEIINSNDDNNTLKSLLKDINKS